MKKPTPMTLAQINEETTVVDTKYVVFKKEEFKQWWLENGSPTPPTPLEDATVIRGQDLFAAPALDSYANAIAIAMMVMPAGDERNSLSRVADYFHDRAQEARMIGYKLPDNGGHDE